ncbi:MAG: tetratricopeptide repeat protein [Wenzhouxiangella sp.]|jgi:predicted negative regulator of RcsB-dependent stress response|nr:tetratricopeptide repeat protein [Wenzhouxiangella sp.]
MAVELYDEHEQGERVRNWIKEYGAAIIMGLVLAFAGIFGFRFWQEQQSVKQARAADYFVLIQGELEAGNLDAAQEAFANLSEEASSSSYVGLAAMMLAAGQVEDGRLEPASRLYRDVLSRGDLEMLQPVATLRLARVLDAQGERQQALEVLGTEPTTGFESVWHELRGDLLFAEGQLTDARLAYQEALDALGGQVGGQRMLQMKLDATGQSSDGESS